MKWSVERSEGAVIVTMRASSVTFRSFCFL